MSQVYFPFDAGSGGSVTEAQWGLMAKQWLGTGVIKDQLNDMQVYADSTGMQVKVKTGQAWIQGHFFQSDAEVVLAIAASNATLARIDRVVARVDWSANTVTLAVLTGVAASSPVAPALTQNTSKWEISLAKISVAANASTIAAGNVTDERIFTGNISLNQTDATQDFYANVQALGNGFHTFYCAGGSVNAPAKSIRGMIFSTGPTYNQIWAMDYQGTIYGNYNNNGTWTGWQALAKDYSTSWATMTLQNAWVNEGSGNFSNASYRLNNDGDLELKGRIKNGTSTTGTIIATLPTGFRPVKNTGNPVVCHNGTNMVAGEIDINADGTITAVSVTNYYVSLDGVIIPLT